MKRLMIICCAMIVGFVSYAQKNEIKAMEKAIKGNNFAAAKSSAIAAEALLANMDDKTKAKFLFLKSKAFYANGAASDSDLDASVKSLDDLKALESKMGKLKYTKEANEIKAEMLKSVLNKADKAYSAKDYASAAINFEKAYQLSPRDTTFLYFAASSAVTGNDYDKALQHYIELKRLGYTGIKTEYLAVNSETGVEESFQDKNMRDISVKSKQYNNPKDIKTESKYAEIVKNIALIYVSQDKKEKALAAIEDAKKSLSGDYNIILSEANIYLELGNKEKAFELFKTALSMDKTNPDLNYNVGVLSMNAEDYDNASTYFNNALRLKPDYANAALNLSTISINKGNAINDEMNKLGMSAADNKKYDELKAQKTELFRDGAIVLQDFLSKNPNSKNMDIYNQLKSIYSAIGETDKLKAIKSKIEEISSGK